MLLPPTIVSKTLKSLRPGFKPGISPWLLGLQNGRKMGGIALRPRPDRILSNPSCISHEMGSLGRSKFSVPPFPCLQTGITAVPAILASYRWKGAQKSTWHGPRLKTSLQLSSPRILTRWLLTASLLTWSTPQIKQTTRLFPSIHAYSFQSPASARISTSALCTAWNSCPFQ